MTPRGIFIIAPSSGGGGGGGISNLVEDVTPQLGGNLDVNGRSIVSVSNGNIAITPNGTGSVVIDGLNHPQADGTADQVLKTNGSGQLAFADVSSIYDIVDDTTPQLGGNLDVNGNKITSVSNGNIDIEPHGTGNVLLGNFTFDADQTVGAGQDNYVLTYDNGTGLISLEAATGGGGGIANVVDDTSPQLGGNLDVNGQSIVSVTNGNIPIVPNGTGKVLIGSGAPSTLGVLGISSSVQIASGSLIYFGTSATATIRGDSGALGGWQFGTSGSVRVAIQNASSEFQVPEDWEITFRDTAGVVNLSTTSDIGVGRNAAGVLGITGGSAGGNGSAAMASAFLGEQAAALADKTGFGQLWVDSADDLVKFTTEGGTDYGVVLDTLSQSLTNKTLDSSTNDIRANSMVVDADNTLPGTATKGDFLILDNGKHYIATATNTWTEQYSALSDIPTELILAVSDETTALTTGTAKVTFRVPYAMTVTEVRASVTTAPTGANLVVDINEGGTTILSTKLSIDATEKTSTTAATAAVISDSALADDAEITIDIDQVGSTVAGAGLKVTLIGTRTV